MNRVWHLIAPQPFPLTLNVGHSLGQTIIMRGWRAEDVERCRLCPVCNVARLGDFASCVVVLPRHVEPEDAALARMETA